MSNWISDLHIQNFKSLRDVSLRCERINLFVGKPNVGKSNLLEALTLLGPDNLLGALFGNSVLRYEQQMANLFYDQNFLEEEIKITTNLVEATLKAEGGNFVYDLNKRSVGSVSASITPNGDVSEWNVPKEHSFNFTKRYQFINNQTFSSIGNKIYLLPPHGQNLLNIIQTNKNFRQIVSRLFEPYGLELLVDTQNQRLEVLKRQDGISFKTPFSLVADTLRRYIFHLAAIESNRDTILLFEEPEAHNYPPFITRLANDILDSKTNQFFLATHSPFLFNTLVENAKDIAVFIIEYEDSRTSVRRLTDGDLSDILNYGLNIFTHQELFADNASF